MEPKFINRTRELEFLETKYNEKGLNFIVIYGRRRVGKTELITHFSKDKDHIYFLANKRNTLSNADRFAEKAANHFNDVKPEARDFDSVFKYIANRMNKKLVVIIDEFSYLVEKDSAIPSVFLTIIEDILKKKDIMVIVCGSSISMMEEGVLSYKSPLYGRRTGEWKLNPFSIKNTIKFFPNLNIKEMIKFYFIFGNVPCYLAKINPEENLFENIRKKILTKGEFLYDEGKNLLMQELKEPNTYFDILEAMAKAGKPGEIANLAKIEAKDLPKYIKKLQKIELVEKIPIITEKKPKKNLYAIKDNFLEFWFRFVYPNKSELEENNINYILNLIKEKFSHYSGKCFEKFCLSLLKERLITIFEFEKAGRHWGKFKGEKGKNTYEIDIVVLNNKTKEILFGECKWKEKVNAKKILKELKEKSGYVGWNNGKRMEHYAIFAKSFKEKIKEKNLYLFDLRDIRKKLCK